MMQVTFLGTSSMVPTKERAPSSIFAEYQGCGILLDCGEGCQRQMNIANINRNKVNVICITHWHADHVAGLVGLLQTINANKEQSNITILGPKETTQRLNQFLHATIFDDHLQLEIIECDHDTPTKVFEYKDLEFTTINLIHSTPVIGYRIKIKDKVKIDTIKKKSMHISDGPHLAALQRGETITYEGKTITPEELTITEFGKSLTYITDTAICPNAIALAKETDLLICESTFSDEHADKAEEYKHMTAQQAGQIASMSNSAKLILTHFSQRYTSTHELLHEARAVFPKTEAAYDFMKTIL